MANNELTGADCPNCGEDASLRHDLCILALEVAERRAAWVRAHDALIGVVAAARAADRALYEAELDLKDAESCEGDLPERLRRSWRRVEAA